MKGLVIIQPPKDLVDLRLFRVELLHLVTDVFFFAVAEHFQLGAVGPEDGALLSHPVHRDGRIFYKSGEILLRPAQLFLSVHKFLLGAVASESNTPRVFQRDSPEQFLFVFVFTHRWLSFSAASFVPTTRARILANAVSRLVVVSSLNGEKPQSSVVPNWRIGMYCAASSTRSQTSSGVSIRGSIGSITPMKICWSGLICFAIIFRTSTR